MIQFCCQIKGEVLKNTNSLVGRPQKIYNCPWKTRNTKSKIKKSWDKKINKYYPKENIQFCGQKKGEVVKNTHSMEGEVRKGAFELEILNLKSNSYRVTH